MPNIKKYLIILNASLVIAFIFNSKVAAQTPTLIAGDANGDGYVSLEDFTLVLTNFGHSNQTHGAGELTNDNHVNILDLNQVLSHFNPPPPVPTPTPNLSASSLRAGTGLSSLSNDQWLAIPSANRDAVLSTNHFIPAIQQAKTQYGNESPDLVLYISNLQSQTRLMQDIQAQFPGVPIGGVANTSTFYNAYTQEAFVDVENRSIAIMTLGGYNISGIHMFQTAIQNQLANNEDYINTGRALATQFKDTLNPDMNNVVYLLGGGGGTKVSFFMCGIKEILINNSSLCNPNNQTAGFLTAITQLSTFLVGTSGDDGSATSANNTTLNNSLTAVVITGSFNISAQGIGSNFTGGDPATLSQDSLGQITSELGANPDILFYIPGHPELATTPRNPSNMWQASQTVLGSNTPLFGNHLYTGDTTNGRGGGYGHRNSDDNIPIGASNYAFYLGLKGVEPPQP